MAKMNLDWDFALASQIIHDHEFSYNVIILLEHADLISRMCFMYTVIMSPPCKGRETYCFSPCVCVSVCLSVRHKIVSAL